MAQVIMYATASSGTDRGRILPIPFEGRSYTCISKKPRYGWSLKSLDGKRIKLASATKSAHYLLRSALTSTMNPLLYPGLEPEDFADLDELVDYLAHIPGSSAELVGSVLAEHNIASRKRAEQIEGSKFVPGNEQLPRVTMSMTPEEQVQGAVKYREWFVGDATAPPYVPGTSSRAALVATQVAARRDQENAIASPPPESQARSLVGVTGFPRHSSTTPWDQLQPGMCNLVRPIMR